jgi:hypothetical protein
MHGLPLTILAVPCVEWCNVAQQPFDVLEGVVDSTAVILARNDIVPSFHFPGDRKRVLYVVLSQEAAYKGGANDF